MATSAERIRALRERAPQAGRRPRAFFVDAEQDANVLEVLIGKVRKDREVDAVLSKCAGILGKPSLVSQSAISCIAAHARLSFGVVDPLNGRFYPIDRFARNRPERSAAGVTRHRRAAGGSRLSAAATDRPQAPLGPFTHWEVFTCIILSADGGTHGNIARANESEAASGAPWTEFHDWGVRTISA
jgi:hypothetical protein